MARRRRSIALLARQRVADGLTSIIGPRLREGVGNIGLPRGEQRGFSGVGRREPFVEISLEQAQAIVYGAVDYARSLDFEPRRDLNTKAQIHLGLRPETLLPNPRSQRWPR